MCDVHCIRWASSCQTLDHPPLLLPQSQHEFISDCFRWPHFSTPQNWKRKRLQECSKMISVKGGLSLVIFRFFCLFLLIVALLLFLKLLYTVSFTHSSILALHLFTLQLIKPYLDLSDLTLTSPHKLMNCTIPALKRPGCRLKPKTLALCSTHGVWRIHVLNRSTEGRPHPVVHELDSGLVQFVFPWVCAITKGQCTRAVTAG